MLTSLIISQVLSWIVILVLGTALLALARQVGVLHMRVAPAGALTTAGGPSVGDLADAIPAQTLEGRMTVVGGPAPGTALRLLSFVGDDEPAAQREMISKHGLERYTFINGPEVGQAYGVGKLPFAVLLDERGAVLSKGLVNSREHLESLVIAHEMGIRSVQDYITGLKAQAA
jgi:hypothetical protein